MFSVSYYKKEQIEKLKSDWNRLERGREMSYFQSYDWNVMLCKYIPSDCLLYESRFVAVHCDQECVLIAPLLFIKKGYFFLNKRGIYFLARNDWSDYVNFIYSDFNTKAVDYLFEELKRKYGSFCCCLENLRTDTSLYSYCKGQKNIISDCIAKCVKLDLPKSAEDYMNMLSRGVKQNIRTAYNRLKKDGKYFEIKFDDKDFDIKRCLMVRGQRSKMKMQREYSFLQLIKIKIIYGFLLYKLKSYYPFVSDANSHMMSLYEDGKLRAFFNYALDIHHRTIVVMAAGIDSTFSRYSPGIVVMFEFIQNSIREGQYLTVDFTRGTEMYKYSLGGKEHLVSNITFRF